MKKIQRCPWPTFDDPLYLKYHDEEWGVPVRDDRLIFEFLVLEAFQAGLSWRTVLHKRDNFRRAFNNFNFRKIARYGPGEIKRLMGDAGIVRNKAKIAAAVNNAARFIEVAAEFGSFSDYMWKWVGGTPMMHRFETLEDYRPFTGEAAAWAKDLKKRGFKFLGPTVIYAHMQATGMVNDHTIGCFRYREIKRLSAGFTA
ncbi:MAG: DNA-3-methyladenine glycosylase I [Spirochaetes bacterium]|nr:MAG: DNA-3-methyladenine glycosylase I [Spirochaetota bacterium]